MTMIGGAGIQGAIEHIGFFKLNPAITNSSQVFAQKAGSVLSTIQSGIAGASFRPLITGSPYEWVFKVCMCVCE